MADESPRSSASDDEDTTPPDDSPSDAATDRERRPGDPTAEEPPAEQPRESGAGSPDPDTDPDTDQSPAPDSHSESDTEGGTADPSSSSSGAPTAGTSPGSPGQRAATVSTEATTATTAAADQSTVPPDVQQYDRFKKIDGARYERVNEFLRDRTYITAREWAIARLCADFRTETGSEMTKIGENLPELVPFMTDTYTPQAVNQARAAFEDKVRKAGATFLYGAMCDFFTADQLDEVMYEATEVAKFLLEVEGVDLAVEEELEAEDRISSVMREVRHASESLRYEGVECPHCGEAIQSGDPDG